ncbi:MAG TPA: hypothetical protein VD997_10465 [Phycisphaerales bacterium]|nr:hypothetical protein [Phycisphaerales bacterium]
MTIDIRNIRDVPRMLEVMKDGRVLARRVKPPFMRAVFALSSVYEVPGRDGAGARIFWFTPHEMRGRVFFALSPMRMRDGTEGAYLDHFYVPTPGQGDGGRCLRMLCELADHHGATICLNAEPEGDKPLDGERLQRWYEKHGFEFSAGIGAREQRGAVRKPKGKVKREK